MRIEELQPGEFESASVGLAEVMADCVDGGASVGFLAPLGVEEAAAWWREAVRAPRARTWVARSEDGVIHGCVQLKPAHFPNGRHRGDVAKLLVHRRARGRALGQALMEVLEAGARDEGLTLLVLDTTTGSFAESLYPRWGLETDRGGRGLRCPAGRPSGAHDHLRQAPLPVAGANLHRTFTRRPPVAAVRAPTLDL